MSNEQTDIEWLAKWVSSAYEGPKLTKVYEAGVRIGRVDVELRRLNVRLLNKGSDMQALKEQLADAERGMDHNSTLVGAARRQHAKAKEENAALRQRVEELEVVAMQVGDLQSRVRKAEKVRDHNLEWSQTYAKENATLLQRISDYQDTCRQRDEIIAAQDEEVKGLRRCIEEATAHLYGFHCCNCKDLSSDGSERFKSPTDTEGGE